MVNPMIALEARSPQMPTYGDLIPIIERGQDRRAAQNALAKKASDEAIMNAAYQQANDPASGLNSNRLAQALASGGLGSQIPGALKAAAEAETAQAGLGKAKIEHLLKFSEMMRNELGNAADPAGAQSAAQRMAQMFPDMAPHLAEGLRTMPQDPAAFGAWKQQVLRQNLTAEQQLQQHYVTQTTADQTRVLAMPQYGGGNAMVVPGSVGSAPVQNQLMWGQGGAYAFNPRTGSAAPVTEGGGGASSALATNPGALKDGPFARSQPGYTGNSGGFATFASPDAGAAAQENLLRNAYIGRGFNTVGKIIDRYAPQGPENSGASVANYKAYVARRAGVDLNAPIPADKVPAVAAAMREFETGNRPGGRQIQAAPTAADKKAVGAKSEAYSQSAMDAFDRAIGTANELMNHPGLSTAVGMKGLTGGLLGGWVVPGTDAADFSTKLNTMKAQVFLPMVQSMKGMGALSNAEGEKLTAAIGNLDPNQSESAFKASLNGVIRDLTAYKNRAMSGGAGAAKSGGSKSSGPTVSNW